MSHVDHMSLIGSAGSLPMRYFSAMAIQSIDVDSEEVEISPKEPLTALTIKHG